MRWNAFNRGELLSVNFGGKVLPCFFCTTNTNYPLTCSWSRRTENNLVFSYSTVTISKQYYPLYASGNRNAAAGQPHPLDTVFQLTDYSWLQIDKDGTWNVLASPSLAKEGVKGIVSAADGLVRRHLAVRLDTVLKTV